MIAIQIKRILFFTVISAFALTGCAKQETANEEAKKQTMKKSPPVAVAQMQATNGNAANGVVTFRRVRGGMQVIAKFTGVPEGEHGFHIHEFGDCRSGDGKSAGGHFNPEGKQHAGPDAEVRHVGDLGNITANAEGIAEKAYMDPALTFKGVQNIIGKGVILHANRDDMTSQPTGAAGARIACGVIERVDESASLK